MNKWHITFEIAMEDLGKNVDFKRAVAAEVHLKGTWFNEA
jgi:hypothetical protein